MESCTVVRVHVLHARLLACERARVKGGLREADLRASEGGLRGRLRETPKSGQWTPRKRSSDERSGGLCRVSAWCLPHIGEPICGGPGRVRDGSGRGVRGGLFVAPCWSSFWSSFVIILEFILELI